MHPLRLRTAIVVLTACLLASLSGCREKHEPLKPTVATAARSS